MYKRLLSEHYVRGKNHIPQTPLPRQSLFGIAETSIKQRTTLC